MKPPRLPVLGVDFDGTLAGPDGLPLPGAVQWLETVHRQFDPVVFSCRADTPSGRVWLEEWVVRHARLAVRATNVKPAGWLVDDRAWNPVREGRLPTVEELLGREGSMSGSSPAHGHLKGVIPPLCAS